MNIYVHNSVKFHPIIKTTKHTSCLNGSLSILCLVYSCIKNRADERSVTGLQVVFFCSGVQGGKGLFFAPTHAQVTS